MPLRVTTNTQGQFAVVTVAGELDRYTAPELRRALDAIAATPSRRRVAVDLLQTICLDVAALDVLESARRRLSPLVVVHLVTNDPALIEWLATTSSPSPFPIFPTVAEACSDRGDGS